MLNVALTGNIASGKSTVAGMLAARGATIIDADILARHAVAPGTVALAAISDRFGSDVTNPDGSLNRSRLRELVFRDPQAREALNAIVHPEVQRLRQIELDRARSRGDGIVISDIPLLFEVGLEHEFDGVIFVDAPESVRIERMITTRGLSREEAMSMNRAQWPASRKRESSNWVINNDSTISDLNRQVDQLWTALNALPGSRPLPLRRSTEDTTS